MKTADYLVPGSGNSLPQETSDFEQTDVAPATRNSAKWASD
jgi:type VI secretion system secreted protein VgrG